MQRRDAILGAMAGVLGGVAGDILPARAALPPLPASGEIGFRILHSGTAIGEHHLKFTQNGDSLRVDITASGVARMAGIPMYSYACTATETWLNGAFTTLDSKVNDNGTPREVHATPIPGGFAVESTKAGNYEYTGQPAMLPLTYWNKAMLDAMILNIETGMHYPAIVSSPGWNNLPTANGGQVLAQRFDVTGKLHLSVWYDKYGQWAGLQFNHLGLLSYQRL
jgi:Family of unknown function (DUF6134)